MSGGPDKAKPRPSEKVLKLMIKYNVPEEVVQALGEEISQDMFLKYENWKDNFIKKLKVSPNEVLCKDELLHLRRFFTSEI